MLVRTPLGQTLELRRYPAGGEIGLQGRGVRGGDLGRVWLSQGEAVELLQLLRDLPGKDQFRSYHVAVNGGYDLIIALPLRSGGAELWLYNGRERPSVLLSSRELVEALMVALEQLSNPSQGSLEQLLGS